MNAERVALRKTTFLRFAIVSFSQPYLRKCCTGVKKKYSYPAWCNNSNQIRVCVSLRYMIRQKGTVIENRTRLILILGLLSAIGPFSIDMYLPGFPIIAESLRTTPEMVSYSLSSYFIGICIGQMLIGPLLDRYGRKRPLYGGLALYIISSIGCAFAPTIEVLIVLRLFQAAGGCVGMVAPRAIIRDLFPVKENARIFSLLILILGVSPIIAPTTGGYITAHFGWQSIFIILSVICA